ncbi:hypothetical protein GGR52DRAFT_574524 [Hypoxylon sp. FL1284]|nr:hypothetical protein GGR52DRAFT_574524 [Hypoxylon sp. FL1284]
MCRGIITHYMHHDVRSPMIIDPFSNHAQVWDNPRHTSYHRCEISAPTPNSTLLESFWPLCTYHSCCNPVLEVHYRDHFRELFWDASGTFIGQNRTDCIFYVEEHEHERYEYLGHPNAFLSAGISCPAPWRQGIQTLDPSWSGRRSANHNDWTRTVDWYDRFFNDGEVLFRLTVNTDTHYLVSLDLAGNSSPDDRVSLENLWQAQLNLIDSVYFKNTALHVLSRRAMELVERNGE